MVTPITRPAPATKSATGGTAPGPVTQGAGPATGGAGTSDKEPGTSGTTPCTEAITKSAQPATSGQDETSQPSSRVAQFISVNEFFDEEEL